MEGLGGLWAHVKWNTSDLLCSMTSPTSENILEIML